MQILFVHSNDLTLSITITNIETTKLGYCSFSNIVALMSYLCVTLLRTCMLVNISETFLDLKIPPLDKNIAKTDWGCCA